MSTRVPRYDLKDVVGPCIDICDLFQNESLTKLVHIHTTQQVHIPPLNHIGLWVDDLSQAVTWMQAQGVRFAPGGIRKGAAGHDIAFIHPKSSDESPISGNGVLIELVQAPKEVIEAFAK
jgi:lactoylglutathione lyase